MRFSKHIAVLGLLVVAALATLGNNNTPKCAVTVIQYKSEDKNKNKNKNKIQGIGTLVAIDGVNYVITALHVLNSAQATIEFGSSGKSQQANVDKVIPERDLAVLKLTGAIPSGYATVSLTSEDQLPANGGPINVASFSSKNGLNFIASSLTGAKSHKSELATAVETKRDGIKQLRAFRTNTAFDFSIVQTRIEAGDSGAGVIDDNQRLLGVVVLKDADGQGNYYGVVVPVSANLIKLAPVMTANNLNPELDPDVYKALTVGLDSRALWRKARPKNECSNWYALLDDLRNLDKDSILERLDNSSGPPTLNVANANIRLVSEDNVRKNADAAANTPQSCGAWAPVIRDLVLVYVEVKTLARRIGTLQTMWSALHTGLVNVPDRGAAQGLGWRQRPTPPDWKMVWANPVENLLVNVFTDNRCLITPQNLPNYWMELRTALDSCGNKCNGSLASSVWPPATAIPSDPGVANIKNLLTQAGQGLPTDQSFCGLVKNPTGQALFWKNLISLALLDVRKTFLYASGMRDAVYDERSAYLRQGAPANLSLPSDLANVAKRVSWPDARIHTLLPQATEVDKKYGALSALLREAKTPEQVIAALVDDPKVLGAAFGKRTQDTPFTLQLDEVRKPLEDLEEELSGAIVELLDEPVGLGTSP